MKKTSLPYVLVLAVMLAICLQATAGVRTKVTRELIEETIEYAAVRSGVEITEYSTKKAAAETLERLTRAYGDDVLIAVRDGGIELVEAVSVYGDEVIEVALKASPAGRRALARNLPDLLPLTRRVGTDALGLEVRAPGLATTVFTTFGDDAGRVVAKNVPTEDLPRLLSYAQKADSPATREMLIKSYSKEGASLFERVPAKLVLSSGLTASMLYGTHRLTEPADAMGEVIKDNSDVAGTAIRHYVIWGVVCAFSIAIILLWRFRLMPWHGEKKSAVDIVAEKKTETSDQAPPAEGGIGTVSEPTDA